jgi:TetR/AcrR family macrolide resistance operon transcriptional repressor
MVIAEPVTREVGRPRVFSDDAIFSATERTLSREGYGRLTLDAIARDIGCTRQALVRRFGSKHSLVRAYLDWSIAQTAKRYQEVRAANPSPLVALRARFLWPAEQRPREIGDPTSQANILSFFIGARDDPEFRERLATINQVYEDEIATFLACAIEKGELREADPRELSHTLIAITTGEVVLWAANPEGDVIQRIGRVFDAVIAPYLVEGGPA